MMLEMKAFNIKLNLKRIKTLMKA